MAKSTLSGTIVIGKGTSVVGWGGVEWGVEKRLGSAPNRAEKQVSLYTRSKVGLVDGKLPRGNLGGKRDSFHN